SQSRSAGQTLRRCRRFQPLARRLLSRDPRARRSGRQNVEAEMRRDANPAPDLQALVERHGGYDKITPAAGAAYDRAIAEWQERRQRRMEDGSSEDLPHAADLEALCICGLPGVVSRKRRFGGRPIWRCEQHHNLWPEYAVEFAVVERER